MKYAGYIAGIILFVAAIITSFVQEPYTESQLFLALMILSVISIAVSLFRDKDNNS